MKKILFISLFVFSLTAQAQNRTVSPAANPVQTAAGIPAATVNLPASQNFGKEIALTEEYVPKEAVFAQPLNLSFSFAHTPGYKVEMDPNTKPKDFDFSAVTGTPNSPGTFTYSITAFPFELKEATLSPITFLLKDSQGNTVASVSTKEVKITVEKAKTFNDNNFREIRDPHFPFSWFKWLLILLLVGGAVYAAWFYWKRRQSAALALGATQDTRPCDVIALSKLDALIQSGLWERQEYKVFYLTLTDIVREYLWRRFQIDTSADTSTEMLRRLKRQGDKQLTLLLPKMRTFLNSSNLVKFARAVPPEEFRNRDIEIVRELVDSTTPHPVPAGSEASSQEKPS